MESTESHNLEAKEHLKCFECAMSGREAIILFLVTLFRWEKSNSSIYEVQYLRQMYTIFVKQSDWPIALATIDFSSGLGGTFAEYMKGERGGLFFKLDQLIPVEYRREGLKIYCKQKIYNLCFKSAQIFSVYLHFKENGHQHKTIQQTDSSQSSSEFKLNQRVEKISALWNFKQPYNISPPNYSEQNQQKLSMYTAPNTQTRKSNFSDRKNRKVPLFENETWREHEQHSNQKSTFSPKHQTVNYNRYSDPIQRKSFVETSQRQNETWAEKPNQTYIDNRTYWSKQGSTQEREQKQQSNYNRGGREPEFISKKNQPSYNQKHDSIQTNIPVVNKRLPKTNKNPPLQKDVVGKKLTPTTKQSNNISEKQTQYQKDIPEKKTQLEPPNKLLKINTKEGRGKEARWKEDYEDSELFDSTLENTIHQIDEYPIKELEEEEVIVDVSFSSLKTDTTRMMVNNDVCSFKREMEWNCFCNEFNNNKILLHNHGDTSSVCQDVVTSYRPHNAPQESFHFPMERKCDTVLIKKSSTIDFNMTHKWKTGISKLDSSQNKRKHSVNFLSKSRRNENTSVLGLEIKKDWSPFVIPLLKINGTPIGYWNNPKNSINLPLNSTTLTVLTPTIGSYFQFIDFWHPDLVKNLQQQLQNLNIPWKLAYYDLFAPVYDGHKLDKDVLPKPRKVCLHFRAPGGPKFYYPHPPNKYAFEAIEESELPIVTSVRETLAKDLNLSFNFTSIILYFDETCQILPHRDGPQQIEYETEKEIIVTLCVHGPKLLFLIHDQSKQKLYFLHKPNQLYIMKGIQNTFQHAKVAHSLKSKEIIRLFPELCGLKDFSHISFICRNIKNWDNLNPQLELWTAVTIKWNSLHELQFFWNKGQHYFGLKPEEPIGHIWLSRYHMVQFGAIGCFVGGFHSLEKYIAAIIDSVYGNYYKQDRLFYFGHAVVTPKLSCYNKKMLFNAQDEIGIRLYVTENSVHPLKPEKGIKLIGEYHVVNAKLMKFSGKDIASHYGRGFTPNIDNKKEKQFQWQFELLPKTHFALLDQSQKNQIKCMAKFYLTLESDCELLTVCQ